MDIALILVFTAVFLVTLFFFNTSSNNLPPGHFKFPIFGSIFLLSKLSKRMKHLVFADEAKKYGSIFRWYLGSQLFVVLSGIDVINEALVKKADIFSDRPGNKGEVTGLSKGIAASNYGQYWRELRRFTSRALRDFGVGKTSMEEKINFEIHTVCDKLRVANGQPISMGDLMRKLVANVNYKIIFGKRFDYDDPELDRITELSDVLNNFSPASFAIFLPECLAKFFKKTEVEMEEKRRVVLNDIARYIGEQTEEHRATFDPANIRDFLDLYLDVERNKTKTGADNSFINKDSMFWVIVDLFVVGTETTRVALCWAFLYLVEFPEVQEKCQNEIDKEVCDKQVQYSDRHRLVYVNAFILEVHRHCCMVPLNIGHCTSQDTTLAGYDIPKGTIIFAMQYSVSMDPKLFKDPEKFDPERFIDEDRNLINNMPFVPFGIGPRVCPGETFAKTEMFLVLTTLLRKFSFLREDPNKPQSFESDITSNQLNCPLPVTIRAFQRTVTE